MSIGQTLQNLFGGSQAPKAPAPTPAAPSQVTQNPSANAPAATTATFPNGLIPGNPDGSPNTGKEPTPFAEFSDLWKTAPSTGQETTSIFGQVDHSKVQEAAGKLNFGQVVSQETLAKIQSGGPEAVAATLEALNKVAQTVYGQSAVATTQLIDKALAEQSARFEAKLPALVRKQSAKEGISGENPIFTNPAVAPVVGMIQSQLETQFPQATAAEIKKMTVKYFNEMTGSLAPKPTKTSTAGKADDGFDWDAFANS